MCDQYDALGWRILLAYLAITVCLEWIRLPKPLSQNLMVIDLAVDLEFGSISKIFQLD